MGETQLVEVKVTRRFGASAERVFDAWLDPAIASRWLFATPGGEMIACEIDARVGGGFRIVERRGEQDAEHLGDYLEIDRPRRIVFAFYFRGDEHKSIINVDITALPDGGCELTLRHERVDSEWADKAQGGWSMVLDQLAAQVEV